MSEDHSQFQTTIRIPTMTADEHQEFLEKWSATKAAYQPTLELLPDRPIDADIEIQAFLTPDGIWGVSVIFTDPEGRWSREDAADAAAALKQIWGVQNV